MSRLRYNNLQGTLGAALTNSGTAIVFAAALTSNGGVAVPTIVAPDFSSLTLEPGTANFEVVSLTAYTSGATTGTVTRGVEGTAVAHASGGAWVHAPTRVDFGAGGEGLTTIATSVASQTLDLSASPVFDVTLAVATTTFTFANPAVSGQVSSFTLWLRQDATGGRAVAWPAAVKWPSGVTPVISSGVGKLDIYTFSTSTAGTTWYGMTAAQDLR